MALMIILHMELLMINLIHHILRTLMVLRSHSMGLTRQRLQRLPLQLLQLRMDSQRKSFRVSCWLSFFFMRICEDVNLLLLLLLFMHLNDWVAH